MKDREISKLIKAEEKRQKGVINLIASENYVSRDVREALGSVFTNKYAEGYSGMRYYGGNAVVDALEDLTKQRALDLFDLSPDEWSVNVQPYSGSPANLAIYFALVPVGAGIMGLELSHGGHLTHGHKASATGKLWKQISYGVSRESELLDYDEIERIAIDTKPAIIVAGYTAYSRIIDFERFSSIAQKVGAIFMVDMSHFAGLVAGGVYTSPFEFADIVMATTHKTLRGPRAAIIFSRSQFASKIDKSVFPGFQGGPHVNQIAAIAAALEEASKPGFKKYAEQVTKNAQELAGALDGLGWKVVSGDTDTHLFLMDTMSKGISGKDASDLLEKADIVVNKNTIPFDTRSPGDPSGIRIGTAAVTTRGMKERDMIKIAGWIDRVLRGEDIQKIKKEVSVFIKKFPVP